MPAAIAERAISLFRRVAKPASEEIAWVQKHHPEWLHEGFNANDHPVYAWTDPVGNKHTVTGFQGRGHVIGKSLPVQQARAHLSSYFNRCRNGVCSHVFSAPLSQEMEPEFVAPQITSHRVNDQVSFEGQPHYVSAAENIDGMPYYDLINAQTGEQQQMIPHSQLDDVPEMARVANILDPVHDQLPIIWDDPISDDPHLRPVYAHFLKAHIYDALDKHGYDNPHEWARLYLTGSLTTYQYSPVSDVDVNVFVDSHKFPDWSRAEMIGIMVGEVDGTVLPNTTYKMQVYVMPHGSKPSKQYKRGLRSGYDIDRGVWVSPPDRSRVMDVKREENAWYTAGVEAADKMEMLLRYEPRKAIQFLNQIHRRRKLDEARGDFGLGNIMYKALDKRGLIDRVHGLTKASAFGTTWGELPPAQQKFLNNVENRLYDESDYDGDIPIVNNPPAGIRMWRGEAPVVNFLDHMKSVRPEDRKSIGHHWTVNPQSAAGFASGPQHIIWQGTLDDPKGVFPRDHPIFDADHSYNHEYELRLREGTPVNVEGYWTNDGDEFERDQFNPYSLLTGWEFHPMGTVIPSTSAETNYPTPYDWQDPEQVWEDKDKRDIKDHNPDHDVPQTLPREMHDYYEQLEEGNPWGIGKATSFRWPILAEVVPVDLSILNNPRPTREDHSYDSDQLRALMDQQHAWDRAARYAMATGRLTPQQVTDLGYRAENHEMDDSWTSHPWGKWQPLPAPLYHVTTNLPEVLRSGRLLTPDELELAGKGRGLGGGTQDTISFTSDLNVARNIRDRMREAADVASGRTSLEQLIADAKSGRGADRPWFDEAYDLSLRDLIADRRPFYQGDFPDDHPLRKDTTGKGPDIHTVGEWRQYGYRPNTTPGSSVELDDDHPLHSDLVARPYTPEERRKATFAWWHNPFLGHREWAGGPQNPLFMGIDPDWYTSLDPSRIGIVQASPVQGGHGYPLGKFLGEWRVPTGDAVNLEGPVE